MTFGLDWVAAALGVTGCYLVGKKKRYGWLIFACASAMNVYIGVHSDILGMAIASFIYFFLEIKGYWEHYKGVTKK